MKFSVRRFFVTLAVSLACASLFHTLTAQLSTTGKTFAALACFGGFLAVLVCLVIYLAQRDE